MGSGKNNDPADTQQATLLSAHLVSLSLQTLFTMVHTKVFTSLRRTACVVILSMLGIVLPVSYSFNHAKTAPSATVAFQRALAMLEHFDASVAFTVRTLISYVFRKRCESSLLNWTNTGTGLVGLCLARSSNKGSL